jgi:Fic family protein
MVSYNWQKKEWPDFLYDDIFSNDLYAYIEKSGLINGMVQAFPEDIQMETIVEIIVSEAIKTSEIEGEYISRVDVKSSVRKNLGLYSEVSSKDKRAKGVGDLMVKVRRSFTEELTEKMLFEWHSALLGYRNDITPGKWRTLDEPMQIISGAYGKIRVHFEAPPAKKVPDEMKRFFKWFNESAPGGKKEIRMAPIRSAIAHLYFESIHPFEDGNGRIGRAIAEKALSQGIGRPVLFSLSKAIDANIKLYYAELEKAQQSMEINSWIDYFIKTILAAQSDSEAEINFTLKKVKYFEKFKNQLSERQLLILNRMLAEGAKGFMGGMNARKYAVICKVSKATATRDLQHLAAINAFIVSGGGRSVSYQVNLDFNQK